MNDKAKISRHLNFVNFEHHPWFARTLKKLSKEERRLCMAFIEQYKELDVNEFQEKVNRWYLDCPDKPKNWTIMQELVSNANVEEKI